MGTSFKHKPVQIAIIIGNTVSILIAIAISGLSNEDILPGVFVNSIGGISNQYSLDITPASWTFSIWGFIYTAQILYCAYTLSLICRKGPRNFLYLSPDGLVPNATYWSYILGNCGNIAWVFLWDRQMFTASGVILALSALFLLIATGASMRGLYMTTMELREQKSTKKEIWLHRILVQNSLAMYATWLCIATLLNIGIVLCYVLGVPLHMAGTVCLGVLTADLVIWFVVDIFIVYRASNYVVVPYIVVIVALAGSLEKNYVPMATNSVFSVVLIIVGSGAFLVKVVTMLWRHAHMPREDDDDSDTDSSKMSI